MAALTVGLGGWPWVWAAGGGVGPNQTKPNFPPQGDFYFGVMGWVKNRKFSVTSDNPWGPLGCCWVSTN